MKIKNINIKGLYGYIDKKIDFNEDITLLVGINGAGKTSILNIVNWIVSPSLPNLCVTEFKSIKLDFDYRGESYTVSCKQGKSILEYGIRSTKKVFSPLIVRLHRNPKSIRNDEMLRSNLIDNYSGLSPDEKEKETWDIISSFPKPTVIGLDRNLFTEESSNKIYFDSRSKIRTSRKTIGPLDRVKELLNREYRKKKNEILKLTNSLKNTLMISTFDGAITLDSLESESKFKLTLNQIVKAEKQVNDYFKNFEEDSLTEANQETLFMYFNQLKELIKKYHDDPDNTQVKILYELNVHQFVKVKKLLKEFEKFETKSTKAMENIQNYLDTLNYFFKDSAKKILFREDTSELTFSNLDKEGNIITEHKDVNCLSSGEQQLLILFSYIAFNSGDGRIFIIDEPELSLHIKWQEDFLDKLELITPKETQLILATHSPILAHKKREKSITLLPYN